ncbi:MAG: acyltransferase [Eubacteriales bacterium]|nr:acyltransferase [Eubacteriales bacterium]
MSHQLAGAAPAGRKFYLDVLRALAIVSISMNHAVNRAYENFDYAFFEFRSIPLWSSWIKVMAIVFGHIGVPLFLMISGALLLGKQIETGEDVKRFYQHNLLPLLLTAEIWYVIMYFFLLVFHTNWGEITLGSALSGLVSTVLFINQTTMDSMWYMPMILCLYLLVPYAAMIVKRVPMRLFLLPCVILYLSEMVFPTINDVFHLEYIDTSVSFSLKSSYLFSMYFLYLFPGYWVSRGGLRRVRGRYLAVGAGLIFLLCCVFQFYAYSRPAQVVLDYDFVLLPPLAALVFELVRRLGRHLMRFQRQITYIAKISFAIYFVHILIMSLLEWYFPYRGWSKPLAMLFLEMVSVSGSVIIILLASEIPLCKKYLFMMKG